MRLLNCSSKHFHFHVISSARNQCRSTGKSSSLQFYTWVQRGTECATVIRYYVLVPEKHSFSRTWLPGPIRFRPQSPRALCTTQFPCLSYYVLIFFLIDAKTLNHVSLRSAFLNFDYASITCKGTLVFTLRNRKRHLGILRAVITPIRPFRILPVPVLKKILRSAFIESELPANSFQQSNERIVTLKGRFNFLSVITVSTQV